MPTRIRSHNELVSDFLARTGHGPFKDYELAAIFSGRHDAPIQFALRHLKTLRVILVD